MESQPVNFDAVINNKPFFITYGTEKELSLCLCKMCINMSFLFEPLMAKAKKDGDECFASISSFLMSNSSCSKTQTGYYDWKCVNRRCRECKAVSPSTLKCQQSEELVSVDQFETVKREYLKYNKEKDTVESKTSKFTDRVQTKMLYKDLYERIRSMRKAYMVHKFFVYNDKYHWPKILSTVPDIGEIVHLDYSENMSQLHKRKAQSCYFNKKAYSYIALFSILIQLNILISHTGIFITFQIS